MRQAESAPPHNDPHLEFVLLEHGERLVARNHDPLVRRLLLHQLQFREGLGFRV